MESRLTGKLVLLLLFASIALQLFLLFRPAEKAMPGISGPVLSQELLQQLNILKTEIEALKSQRLTTMDAGLSKNELAQLMKLSLVEALKQVPSATLSTTVVDTNDSADKNTNTGNRSNTAASQGPARQSNADHQAVVFDENRQLESEAALDDIVSTARMNGAWESEFNDEIMRHSIYLDKAAKKRLLDKLLTLINSQTLGESAMDINLAF